MSAATAPPPPNLLAPGQQPHTPGGFAPSSSSSAITASAADSPGRIIELFTAMPDERIQTLMAKIPTLVDGRADLSDEARVGLFREKLLAMAHAPKQRKLLGGLIELVTRENLGQTHAALQGQKGQQQQQLGAGQGGQYQQRIPQGLDANASSGDMSTQMGGVPMNQPVPPNGLSNVPMSMSSHDQQSHTGNPQTFVPPNQIQGVHTPQPLHPGGQVQASPNQAGQRRSVSQSPVAGMQSGAQQGLQIASQQAQAAIQQQILRASQQAGAAGGPSLGQSAQAAILQQQQAQQQAKVNKMLEAHSRLQRQAVQSQQQQQQHGQHHPPANATPQMGHAQFTHPQQQSAPTPNMSNLTAPSPQQQQQSALHMSPVVSQQNMGQNLGRSPNANRASATPVQMNAQLPIQAQAQSQLQNQQQGQGQGQMQMNNNQNGYQGIPGMQNQPNGGVNGMPMGMQNMQGVNGMNGMQNLQGMAGMQGMQGMSGMNGMQGMQGLTMMNGMNGIQGQGMQGMNGMPGFQGQQTDPQQLQAQMTQAKMLSDGFPKLLELKQKGMLLPEQEKLFNHLLTTPEGRHQLERLNASHASSLVQQIGQSHPGQQLYPNQMQTQQHQQQMGGMQMNQQQMDPNFQQQQQFNPNLAAMRNQANVGSPAMTQGQFAQQRSNLLQLAAQQQANLRNHQQQQGITGQQQQQQLSAQAIALARSQHMLAAQQAQQQAMRDQQMQHPHQPGIPLDGNMNNAFGSPNLGMQQPVPMGNMANMGNVGNMPGGADSNNMAAQQQRLQTQAIQAQAQLQAAQLQQQGMMPNQNQMQQMAKGSAGQQRAQQAASMKIMAGRVAAMSEEQREQFFQKNPSYRAVVHSVLSNPQQLANVNVNAAPPAGSPQIGAPGTPGDLSRASFSSGGRNGSNQNHASVSANLHIPASKQRNILPNQSGSTPTSTGSPMRAQPAFNGHQQQAIQQMINSGIPTIQAARASLAAGMAAFPMQQGFPPQDRKNIKPDMLISQIDQMQQPRNVTSSSRRESEQHQQGAHMFLDGSASLLAKASWQPDSSHDEELKSKLSAFQPAARGLGRSTLSQGLSARVTGDVVLEKLPEALRLMAEEAESESLKEKMSELDPTLPSTKKRKIQDVAGAVDKGLIIDGDVETYLLEIAEEHVDMVCHAACNLAKHRRSDTIDRKDLQLAYESVLGRPFPGFSSDQIRADQSKPGKRPPMNAVRANKLRLVNDAKAAWRREKVDARKKAAEAPNGTLGAEVAVLV